MSRYILNRYHYIHYPKLGSSIAFHNELQGLALKLNFELGSYSPYFTEERRQMLVNDPFGQEKWVLLCLYTIATASIHYGSAIVFSG